MCGLFVVVSNASFYNREWIMTQDKCTNQKPDMKSRVWYQTTMARFRTKRRAKDPKKPTSPSPPVKIRIQETSAGTNTEPPGAHTYEPTDSTEEESMVRGKRAVPKREKPIMTGQLLDRVRKKFEKWRKKGHSSTDSNKDKPTCCKIYWPGGGRSRGTRGAIRRLEGHP